MVLPLLSSPRWAPRCAAMLLAMPCIAGAQPDGLATEHVRAQLLAHAPQGVAPGTQVWLALAIDHAPHWHTYWKNPGDSGLPTSLTWRLGDGASAGGIAWPTPQALPVGPLMNHGYEGAVLLSVPVTIPAGFAASALRAHLQAEWLACKDVCVQESGEFALTIPARVATTK